MNPLATLLLLLLLGGRIQAQTLSENDASQPAQHRVPIHLAALVSTDAAANERNLLANGDFEHGTRGWELIAFGKKGKMAIDTKELFEGKPTLRIDNVGGDHSFVRQIVKGKPNTRYRLAGYIKTLNVEPVKGSGKEGAVVMIGMVPDTSEPLQKTTRWTRVSVDFTPKDPSEIRVGPSLGTYARPVTGTAWFYGITLTELGKGGRR
jgi:hypothetical protein